MSLEDLDARLRDLAARVHGMEALVYPRDTINLLALPDAAVVAALTWQREHDKDLSRFLYAMPWTGFRTMQAGPAHNMHTADPLGEPPENIESISRYHPCYGHVYGGSVRWWDRDSPMLAKCALKVNFNSIKLEMSLPITVTPSQVAQFVDWVLVAAGVRLLNPGDPIPTRAELEAKG
jgi:hypothetical protein